MIFKDIQGVGQKFLTDNASTILTAGGVVGTVMTAILTGRASYKSAEIIREQEYGEYQERQVELTKFDKVQIVWPQFVPPVVVGGLTIASIVAANQISASRAAALAAAYGVSQNQLEEYKAKLKEKLTGPKNQQIKDEIAQDRVNKYPPDREVVILASGDVLCFDMYSGRYFQSTVERVRKAEQFVNRELAMRQYCSLSQYYDEVGLPPTSMSDTVGWTMLDQDQAFELQFSTTLTQDDKPCIAVDFNILPKPDYGRNF